MADLDVSAPTPTTDPRDDAGQAPKAGRKEWIGLLVIALPCLLYSMDLTVLNLALPRISADLEPSGAQLLWIVDIYGFFVAGLLVTMGTLGDRFGRRRVLLVGAAAFGAASVFAALSRSAPMLIAARAVLGVAGATLAPSTLSLIRNMFLDPRQRATAVGVWITSYSVGGAIGPVLGGLVLQRFSWSAAFLLGVPVMALLLAVGPFLLPEYRAPRPRRPDLPSAALSLAAVLAVIFGVKACAQDGPGGVPLATVAAGGALGWVFVRRQRALADPLIDLRLFHERAFSTALAVYLLATLVAFGSYVLLGQFIQLVMGLSALEAGLWTLPWAAGFIAGSTLAPVLARRTSTTPLIAGGLVMATLGFLVQSSIVQTGLPGLVVSEVLISLGLAPVFTLGTDLVIGSAPPENAGAAAAISETSSELGGAVGVAVIGSLGMAIYRAGMAPAVAALPAEATRAARDTLGGAVAVAAQLPAAQGARLLAAAHASFGRALQLTLVGCSGLAALTAVLFVVALRKKSAAGR